MRHDLMHWSLHKDRLLHLRSASRLGIISDFDGTLSQFVEKPTDAAIIPENAQALDTLSNKVTLIALLSGRSAGDLRGRFERPYLIYHGNHGMDYWHDAKVQFVDLAVPWVQPLREMLAALPLEDDVYIENKGVTASIHYRRAENPGATRLRLRAQLQPLCDRYGLVLSEGSYVWEIKPPIHVSKGTVLRTIVENHRLNGVLFLGDDATDLLAMDALNELCSAGTIEGLSVGVTHIDPRASPADLRSYCDVTAHGTNDVAHLLTWFAEQVPQVPVSEQLQLSERTHDG